MVKYGIEEGLAVSFREGMSQYILVYIYIHTAIYQIPSANHCNWKMIFCFCYHLWGIASERLIEPFWNLKRTWNRTISKIKIGHLANILCIRVWLEYEGILHFQHRHLMDNILPVKSLSRFSCHDMFSRHPEECGWLCHGYGKSTIFNIGLLCMGFGHIFFDAPGDFFTQRITDGNPFMTVFWRYRSIG